MGANVDRTGWGQVLVTGGTGFTGGRLVERLRREGAAVTVLARPTSDTSTLETLGATVREVDLTDHDAVRRAMEPFDTVFHLAAAFRQQHPDLDEFERVNVHATGHLLEAARDHGAGRFVHCSTVGVHGEIRDPPASEDEPLDPGDPYQRSKLRGEALARRAMKRSKEGAGMAVTVVRPVGIYGPGDLRFLKLFRAIARRRFVMVGSGDTLYHLTHVDDVVEGLCRAATHSAAPGEVFTIGGDAHVSLNTLVRLIAEVVDVPPPRWRIPYAPVHAAAVVCDRLCRLVGVPPPLYPRRVRFFSEDRAFDVSKARSLLGYRPSVELRAGLAETAAWYRASGML